jgi:tRNA threonylcarbamoyladenosine biosynthesis protein TsaB
MSLALLRGHELQAQWGVRSLQPSAHRVVADIAYMLERTGLRPTDLTAIGALVGPGSFTGIRVGLAAVKGLAQPLNCPIATATTLEVLADAVAPLQEPTTVVVLTISHRREVHGQVFFCRAQSQTTASHGSPDRRSSNRTGATAASRSA